MSCVARARETKELIKPPIVYENRQVLGLMCMRIKVGKLMSIVQMAMICRVS